MYDSFQIFYHHQPVKLMHCAKLSAKLANFNRQLFLLSNLAELRIIGEIAFSYIYPCYSEPRTWNGLDFILEIFLRS